MKLTSKDFEYFKDRCHFWIERFGMIDWQVHYEMGDIEDNRGRCLAHYKGRVATIALTDNLDCRRKELHENLDRTAFHEVMELFLSPLECCARSRIWDDDIYDRENHAIIRTLENIFIGYIERKKK